MSQRDPSSLPMGVSDLSPAPLDSSQSAARGRNAARSIVPGLTLFCLNLALGAFLIVSYAWPGAAGSPMSNSPAPVAPAPAATGVLNVDPIESPPTQETPVTVSLTPAPTAPAASSTPRAHATVTAVSTATTTPQPATPTATPVPIMPSPTPTLTSVG
ncbi:MAG TPA: hypothetical protein VFN78_15340 [Ktedonobacterales bacterium]|nr:hypothetical protein [Ktedonobacterales bacterium]